MKPVRMVHPTHGYQHAYDDAQIAGLKVYGWSVAEEPAPVAAVVEAPVDPVKKLRKVK